MARIVGVHGILNDFLGEESLANAWGPALRDGLRRAACPDADGVDVRVVFYGELFRPKGKKALLPRVDLESLDATESELLAALAAPLIGDEIEIQKARTPKTVQRLLKILMHSEFFARLAGAQGERALLFGLREVKLYLHDEAVRDEAQRRVAAAIGADTRIVVGHSLGSVIAYEALCTGRFPQVHTFVTIGSPLGMPRIVFDALRPPPVAGRDVLPPIDRWTNVADDGDLVALVKELRPLFGAGDFVVDHRVHNGWASHDVLRYLTSEEVGRAVAAGLRRATPVPDRDRRVDLRRGGGRLRPSRRC